MKDNKKFVISITPVKIMGLIFFMYTLGAFCVPMLGWSSIMLQLPLYLFFAVCLLSIKKNFVIRTYVWWYLPFIAICCISSLYAPIISEATNLFPSLFMAFIFGLSISIFLSYDGSLRYIKYSFILVALFVGCQLIMTFQQKSWWSRLGEAFGMNENMVALYFLIPFCFAFDELQNKKFRILNIIAIIIFAYVIMLTGSKKALFAAIIYSLLLSILKAGKITKKIRIILVSGIVVVFIFNLLMSVELLYNILGHRIEEMISAFVTGDFSSSSNSTGERGDMIFYGLELFAKSPFMGWGLNAFQRLYGNVTGHYAYAHNNYVELLADLGIVGFALYYSLSFKIAKCVMRLKHQLHKNALFISLFAVILFYDLAMVSFYDTRIIMLYMIVFSGLYNNYHEKEV